MKEVKSFIKLGPGCKFNTLIFPLAYLLNASKLRYYPVRQAVTLLTNIRLGCKYLKKQTHQLINLISGGYEN